MLLFTVKDGKIIMFTAMWALFFTCGTIRIFLLSFVGSSSARGENVSSTALKWRITPVKLEWWDTVVKDSRR